MNESVVTTLTIDASGASAGANEFARAMDSARTAADRALGGVNTSLSGVVDSIKSLGVAGISITAAMLGMVKWASDQNREMAQLDRTARQVGTTLERFQSLRFAANIGGIDEKQFESSMQRATGLLNDAQRNANSLKRIFDENGISVRNTNGQLLSGNQLLGTAADLVKRAATEQDKFKIAEMLGFTREWVPFLEQGASAINRIASEAKAAGAIIDDETIKKAADFDKEWRKSAVLWEAAMKSAAVGILPYINDLIDSASKILSKENLMKFSKQGQDAIGSVGVPNNAEINLSEASASLLTKFVYGLNWSVTNVGENVVSKRVTAAEVEKTFNLLIDGLSAVTGVTFNAVERLADAHRAFATPAVVPGGGRIAEGARDPLGLAPAIGQDNKPWTQVPAREAREGSAIDQAAASLAKHTERQLADAKAVGVGAGGWNALRASQQTSRPSNDNADAKEKCA